MSITNNSEYPIFGIQFDYKTKDTVTEEELDVYTDFMKEHYTYIKENDSARDVIIRADGEKLIKNGETFDEMYFTVGFQRWSWYDYPTDEQFNLMEPKELQLGIIGKDNVAYVAYYDFEKNEWLLDEEAKEINTWPNNELAKKIGKPNLDYYFLDSDLDEEDIEFYAYGITQDVYKSYAESLKNVGFNIDVSEDDSDFEAYDKQGNELSISYYEEKEKMVVDIYFNEESTFVEEVSEDNSYIPETITNTEVNTSANINTNTSESSDLVDGMRPRFKAAMDSYETFMTEYCNFMKKYLDSDGSDLSLMTDYAEYMKKYAEFVKDFEAWEDDTEMNAAETNYYIDVQARVSKKLLEVSQ